MTDTSAIPAEAVAVIAAHFHAATCRAVSLNAACDGATTADFELARYALAAALPHLPRHQHEAYEAGYETGAADAAFESWSELLDCAGGWPPSPRVAFRAGQLAAAPQAAAAAQQRIREHILNRSRQLAVGLDDPVAVVELWSLARELGWTGDA